MPVVIGTFNATVILAALLSAFTGLYVLVFFSLLLSILAVVMSISTRRGIAKRAENLAADAVAITVEHGGVPITAADRDSHD